MKAGIEHWYRWNSDAEGIDFPTLDFLPPRARRRLSKLSRAVLEVGHQLCARAQTDDVVYASMYGETTRQLEITRGLLDDNEVSPSSFSYSVFNTPVALLSLHEKIRGRTRAVFAGRHSLSRGLMQAVISRAESERVLFLYGDESVPEVYLCDGAISGPTDVIGLILGPAKTDSVVELAIGNACVNGIDEPGSVCGRLAAWLTGSIGEMVIPGAGYSLRFQHRRQ